MEDREMGERTKRLALVASKGTLDQAYPPLILASTAAAMRWEVGIFFTFYGLDILHKERIKGLQVSSIGNPAMPPPVPAVPGLKVPNLLGALPGMTAIATSMMKGWMDRAKMPSVQELLELCVEADVNLFACATTMGVMGIKQEDLIPAARCAGATTFLDYAADADVSLFV
jgi:peroxiredoxin family protein